jgi:two-component system sensor histidine kinase/response regulator
MSSTTGADLAMREDTPPDIHRKLERVISSGIRMQRMIEQFLDLTRARLAGGIPVTLSAEATDLEPLVTKIAEEVRVAYRSTTIDVQVNGNCLARVDADRFEQVVSNLLGNAVSDVVEFYDPKDLVASAVARLRHLNHSPENKGHH